MTWFYNSDSGELTSASGIEATLYEAAIHTGLGWHELHIPASSTEAQAAAAAVQEVPGGVTPTTSIVGGLANAPSGLAGQAATAAGDATGLSGLNDIGDFFHRLTESNTWVRVGEVAFGAILLWVGVKALSAQTPVGKPVQKTGSVAKKTVTKPVKTAVKVAVPEARLARRVVSKKIAPKTTARVAAHRQQVRQYGRKNPYNP